MHQVAKISEIGHVWPRLGGQRTVIREVRAMSNFGYLASQGCQFWPFLAILANLSLVYTASVNEFSASTWNIILAILDKLRTYIDAKLSRDRNPQNTV